MLRQQRHARTGSASSSTSPGRRRGCSLALPEPPRLVEALFAYDVIGFQTHEWLESFRRLCHPRDGRDRSARTAASPSAAARSARSACPIGIDAKEFIASANSRGRARHARAHARERDRAQPDRRRRPARLFQGAGGALPRLRALPRRASRSRARRSICCRSRRPRATMSQSYQDIRATLDALSGRINGALCRHRLGADPLRQPGLSARRAGRHLSRRAGRAGHAAARRDEPRRQGICRGAGSRRSRRADPVALRRRRRAAGRCAAGQSL